MAFKEIQESLFQFSQVDDQTIERDTTLEETYSKWTPKKVEKERRPPSRLNLFTKVGLRRNGIEENKKWACIRCEKEANMHKHCICDECKRTETYRYASVYF